MKNEDDKKFPNEHVPESEPAKKRKKEEEFFIQEEAKKLKKLKDKMKQPSSGADKKK